MSPPRLRPLQFALLAGLAAGLSGCAVLQIDVDVYKGPLANEEAVQVQQFAAMAIGAKPLLIQLRDNLQWRDGPEAVENKRKQARKDGWYKADFVVPPPDKEQWKADAARVNAVLSLYKDLDLSGLEKILAVVEKSARRYKSSVAILKPDETGDKKLWESISLGFKPAPKDESVEPKTGSQKLRVALKKLLYPGFSKKRPTIRPIVGLFDTYEAAQKEVGKVVVREGDFGKYVDKEVLDAVGEVDLLRKSETLEGVVSLIFENKDGVEAKKFTERAKELTAAYLDAREAFRDMWLAWLDALRLINSPNFEGKDPQFLTSAVVEALKQTTQPQHLALAINFPSAFENGTVLQDLKNLLEAGEGKAFWDKSLEKAPTSRGKRCWTENTFKQANQIVGRTLFLNPTKAAALFLQTDEILRGTRKNLQSGTKLSVKQGFEGIRKRLLANDCLAKKQSIKELERFGLVRGPRKPDDELDEIKQILDLAGKLKVGAAVGFARGRLDHGIETLIRDYLETTKVLFPNDREKEERRQAGELLREALVRFAEKVLFIANNEKLLSEAGEGIDRYILVLQAVGNAILIQADELRNRAKFALDLQYREAPEIWAQELVVTSPPDKSFRKWSESNEILGAVKVGKRSQVDVLDDLIAVLRYRHIKAMEDGGKESDEVKRVAEALQVAYEQRAGMAYIRPSGAYLRSSYPATSLQGDPGLGWRNMLADHGLRTTPVIGELLARGNKEDQLRAEITAEIDKQFWQNINSVRVAGAGITNYVIAKDDIGNWYVKSFTADPAQIIKSAKSLAMFGIGQGFDPDLMKETLKDKKEGEEEPPPKQPKSPPAALKPVLTAQWKIYSATTKQDAAQAQALLKTEAKQPKMRQDIERAWAGNRFTQLFPVELQSALDAAVEESLVPEVKSSDDGKAETGDGNANAETVKDEEKEGEENAIKDAGQIVAVLTQLKGFYGTLRTKILILKLSKGAELDLAEAKKARDDAKNALDMAQTALDAEQGKTAPDAPDPAVVFVLQGDVNTTQLAFDKTANAVAAAEKKVREAPLAEKTAIDLAGAIVRTVVSFHIDRRLTAVKDFETAIILLGGVNTSQ